MIFSSKFPLDSDRWIQLQYDSYDEAVGKIVNFAQTEYLRAELVLGLKTDLGKQLPVYRFDHRTVQNVHDLMAAQFRYLYINTPTLFEGAHDQDADILAKWFNFISKELCDIAVDHPSLYRLLCTAVVYKNPDERGIEAELELHEMMGQRYSHFA